MGTSFFITPREDIDPTYEAKGEKYRLEPEEFAKALKAKWKNTEIGMGYTEHFDMSWECEVNYHHKLRGSLFHDFGGVVLEKPSANDVEEFAIWFRTLVPDYVNLVVYNSSDITPFEIKPDTTYLQIVDFFSHLNYWITVTLVNNEPIDIKDLSLQLRAQWPEVEIFPITDADPLSFYWEIKLEHEFTHHIKLSETESVIDQFTQDVIVSGAVSRNSSEMYLTPFPYSELAKMLIWYRGIMDESIELLVERREDHRQLKLQVETTEQEIIETFRRHWEMGM
jgi:hypothetical protein